MPGVEHCLNARFEVFFGSERVHHEMKERIDNPPLALTDAASLLRDSITLCKSYQDVDSDCANIGGHIHIGHLEPNRFSWIDPPIR